jgi:hypothetical protein
MSRGICRSATAARITVLFLSDAAASLRLNHLLFNAVAEAVRDLAAKLPVRGIDYGIE